MHTHEEIARADSPDFVVLVVGCCLWREIRLNMVVWVGCSDFDFD